VFEELSGEPTDVFAVGQRGGRPLVSGSSGVALTTGLYHYLKYFCNASVSVGALPQLALPQPLPLPRTRVRVPSPLQFHWYGSFMANSYTQAFWGWDRWESHLDWCALLGFDLVMVCESLRPRSPRITTSSAASQLSALLLSVRRSVDAGAEQVHAAVYAELGVTEAELGTFFSGAAFLGWSSTRAGNLRGMGGPITPQWRASKLALGRQIVARCRELGITPVLSGFNGHVPEALLKRIRPGSKYTRARPWNGFNCTDTDALGVATPPRPGCSSADCPRLGVVDVAPPFGCGFEVDPRDPLFLEIGARFIRKQRELYGNASDVHFYAAIQFTEEIPSAGSTLLPTADPAFLAAWGRATHGGMVAADPQAVWVLDGWFANANGEPWFWCGANRSRAQAYLSAVPLGGILILDLAADWTEHWRDPSFFGHPFIWCQFHENGGIMGDPNFQCVIPFRRVSCLCGIDHLLAL
jgi:alpha-N-acetylglucosaminidase